MRLSRACRLALSACLLPALLLVLLSPTTVQHADAAVLGIDFGSEYIKVVSVQPGQGFHILLDEQTKRKWPSLVAFDSEERFFGNNAVNTAVKKPTTSFSWVKRLLGVSADHSVVQELTQDDSYPYNIVPSDDDRQSVAIELRENAETVTPLTAEEIIAMQLQHILRLAESDSKGAVKDAVISVPDWWSQSQRQSMLDAAEIAGVNVLALINDNSAAAVQYGIDKKFDSINDPSQHVLFFNMGATSTQVTLAQYSPFTAGSGRYRGKVFGQVEIKATTADTTLGGHAFERVITNWLVEQVQQKLVASGDTTNIRSSPRAMAKVRTAADKAKTVLSANPETPIYLTSLINDLDFNFRLTREQYYALCQPLFDRIRQPLEDIMTESKLQSSEIDSIVIIGGSVRIPGVQSAIKQVLNRETLSQNLNGDEAIAFGAAFRAANLSAAFQVRPFGLVDVSPYPVGVRISDLTTSDSADATTATDSDSSASDSDETGTAQSGKKFSKRAALFKRWNQLNKRKLVTIPHTVDLTASLFYDNPPLLPSGTAAQLSITNITGIYDLTASPKYSKLLEEQQPKVSLSFVQDANSITLLLKAEATLEEQVEVCTKKPKPKVKPSKANDTAKADDTVAAEADAPIADATSTETPDADSTDAPASIESEAADAQADTTASKDTATKDDVVCTQKKKTHTIALKLTTSGHPQTTQSMQATHIQSAQERLLSFQRRDDAKRALAAARNGVESYIYATRSALHEDDVEKVSTEDERQTLRNALEAAEEWLYETHDEETVQLYKSKRKELRSLAEPIELRASELTARPAAIEQATEAIANARLQLDDIAVNKTWIKANQTEALSDLLYTTQQWLSSKQAEQEQLPLTADPILTSSQVHDKVRAIQKLQADLARLRRPKPPAPKFDKDFLKKFNLSDLSNFTMPTDNETDTVNAAASATGTNQAEDSSVPPIDATAGASEQQAADEPADADDDVGYVSSEQPPAAHDDEL